MVLLHWGCVLALDAFLDLRLPLDDLTPRTLRAGLGGQRVVGGRRVGGGLHLLPCCMVLLHWGCVLGLGLVLLHWGRVLVQLALLDFHLHALA